MADPTRRRGPLDDPRLKQAYRLASGDGAGPHLSETEWEQLACGELDAEASGRAHAHITTCARCAEIWHSLDTLAVGAAQFDPEVVRPAVSPAPQVSRTWTYLGGLAAAAAIFAAVTLDFGGPLRGPADEVMRTSTADTAIAVVVPQTDAVLAGRRFAWQGAIAADAYELRISTPDGGAVWVTRVATTEARLPPDLVLTGGRYYWQVTAFRENTTIAASPLVAFRVE